MTIIAARPSSLGGYPAPSGRIHERYRADIDGLRAIAVCSVVIFHASPKSLTGGFVGVDIFFVISGFLITGIIARQVAEGQFSILDFYERRCRRILPALALVIIATLAAALAILPPLEMKDFGLSLVSVSTFLSNMLFWTQGGYFGGPAHDRPLLHTWSLSVEEQFYIVWPLFLFVALRWFRPQLITALLIVGVAVSIPVAELSRQYDLDAAFYLAPLRAWELVIGALVALARPDLSSRWLRELVAALGLGAILVAVLAYGSRTPFPGISAALPVLGAAALLLANREGGTLVARLLSLRPFVFVGLISYSLYLWHWPALVMPQIWFNRSLSAGEAAGAVLASFALAGLSWRYVERPFRRRNGVLKSRAAVLGSSLAVLLPIGTAGVACLLSDGLDWRTGNGGVAAAEGFLADVGPLRDTCLVKRHADAPGPMDLCRTGSGGPYQILLWGDSHADHLHPGIVAAKPALDLRETAKVSCPPLVGETANSLVGMDQTCRRFGLQVLAELRSQPSLQVIIATARWTSLVNDWSRAAPDAIGLTPAEAATAEEELRLALLQTLAETRAALGRRVQVILVGSVPDYPFRPATCLARERFHGRGDARCTQPGRLVDARMQIADTVIARIAAADPDVSAVFPTGVLCPDNQCITAAQDDILYWDNNHLSTAGSRLIAQTLLVPAIEQALSAARNAAEGDDARNAPKP